MPIILNVVVSTPKKKSRASLRDDGQYVGTPIYCTGMDNLEVLREALGQKLRESSEIRQEINQAFVISDDTLLPDSHEHALADSDPDYQRLCKKGTGSRFDAIKK